ncbi:Rieske 2Fe-2S domain-containing protein [Asanoa sp. WMMD1127]|uniref:Rieske 2Fe-2S domain-containing protein n=1 Tax=Asanoa sp. WMMD1127 TaxID=3016107 RepID=UPI00241682F5|nr:Rieske 2Fe-2S domain-containing protein [Asanoa sp. WMMD1127]MDG4824103.1 Rieske 2Fe-2S domain-containing protein [Asanoa sp. WMMD1127]
MKQLLTRLEQASGLDRISDPIQRALRAVLKPRLLRDTLHGVQLGHPVHPALASFTLGSWTSAAVLDVIPRQELPATTLVGVGVAGAVPTALAGLNDWAELDHEQRRVGLVHMAANVVTLGLYSASLAARLRGDHRTGRILGFAAFGVVNVSAFLGGHLAYKQGAQVNQAVAQLHRISDGWHPVADISALPHGVPVARSIGEVPVLVYRDGDRVSVLLERCGHETGPLSEGRVVDVDGDTCVECPWHGSVFRLNDGLVMHGPAGSDQPVLRTRIVNDVVEANLP